MLARTALVTPGALSFALLTPRLQAFRVVERPESSIGAIPPAPKHRSGRSMK